MITCCPCCSQLDFWRSITLSDLRKSDNYLQLLLLLLLLIKLVHAIYWPCTLVWHPVFLHYCCQYVTVGLAVSAVLEHYSHVMHGQGLISGTQVRTPMNTAHLTLVLPEQISGFSRSFCNQSCLSWYSREILNSCSITWTGILSSWYWSSHSMFVSCLNSGG